MMTQPFAGALRATRALSRCGTLLTAMGAVVAAAAPPLAPAAAGKSRNKARKRCQRQRDQCRAFLTAYCAPQTDSQACEALHLPCCDPFARCDAEPAVA